MIAVRNQIAEWIIPIESRALKIGFICGVSQISVGLIGMVESFHRRFILYEKISLGQAILLAIIFFLSNLTVRKSKSRSKSVLILNSTMCGLISGVMLGFFIFFGTRVNLRAVFVNASPDLFQILTLGMNPWLGITAILTIMVFCGCLNGIYCFLSSKLQKVLLNATVSVLVAGIFHDFIRVLLVRIPPEMGGWIVDFLFPFHNGLSFEGAFFLFGFVFCLNMLWQWKREKIRRLFTVFELDSEKSTRERRIYFLFLIPFVLLPFFGGAYLCEVVNMIGLYVLLGLGLNFVVGYAGLLDLGYVAFFAVGSYVMAIMTSTELNLFHFGFWQTLPFAIISGTLVGILLGIPVLKMRGDYLAIATLGFGEIIRILVNSDLLKPILNGPTGIGGIPKAALGPLVLNRPNEIYFLILSSCFLAVLISMRLNHSRIGRAWKAIREDEDVAQAMGINLVYAKLTAFGIGAGFAALSGAIFAVKIGSVFPTSFSLMVSVNVMCLIIIGGLGKAKGVIMGAFLMIGLPEFLQEFSEYRYLLYGIAITAIMIFKPGGLCSDNQS